MVNDRHTGLRPKESERHGVKRVNMLPLLLSWMEHPNNPPNLVSYVYFMNLVTDRVSFMNYSQSIDRNRYSR